ncbi:hypothetical protein ACFQV2_32420 [Actinokineospora soli]|uniref:Uncharacterized protein n=1 Tax=Actinokineospora soli TaxID=1048753 RepID=A0ABW2TU77_9PSEU
MLNRPLLLDKADSGLLVVFLLLIEVGLLVQAVIGFVRLAGTDRAVDGWSFGGTSSAGCCCCRWRCSGRCWSGAGGGWRSWWWGRCWCR